MSEENKKVPSLFDVVKSVMWGMLGVQKSENHQRDFSQGKPWQYIVIGMVAVAIFIGTIITVVSIVMSKAGI